jgi:hypothetical protein
MKKFKFKFFHFIFHIKYGNQQLEKILLSKTGGLFMNANFPSD